jgi:hypothetical protein
MNKASNVNNYYWIYLSERKHSVWQITDLWSIISLNFNANKICIKSIPLKAYLFKSIKYSGGPKHGFVFSDCNLENEFLLTL